MSIYADKIMTLFRECKIHDGHCKKYEKRKYSSRPRVPGLERKTSDKFDECNIFRNGNETFAENSSENEETREILTRDIERLVSRTKIRTASVEFASLNKMLATLYFAARDEITAIGHLIESHAVILQQQVYHRYTKTQVRKQFLEEVHESGLKPIHARFDPKSTEGSDSLREKLAQMPQEWYMVQITVGYMDPRRGNDSVLDSTPPLHITILPTGKNGIEPFCITLPSPNYGEYQMYDGLKEIVKIQINNKADLEGYYIDNKSYWKMREKQNNKMKIAMKELEHSWLREWRILLMADPLENSTLVKDMRDMIDKLIADDLSAIDVSPRTRWLLRKIATSSCYLSKLEIARAVNYILDGNEKLANNVILSIHGKLTIVNDLRAEKRRTLVMIVDESIDHVPFETMEILRCHPVTRFPSFHIACAMFKEHEADIVEGCKIVRINDKFGTFIVNPARNLEKMEKRIKLFVDYWLPHWKGIYGAEPDENHFERILVENDALLYSGHGSGIQYLPGEKIEKLRVRATVLLFGCSSVKLHSTGGRFPPYGISNQYLIACSPCILGMLWEVTDADIDRMTARFMSDWIPSVAEKPWSCIDIKKWCDGVLKFRSPGTTDPSPESTGERELLRAVANSKEVCTQWMTSAAIIVRGLPIRLE